MVHTMDSVTYRLFGKTHELPIIRISFRDNEIEVDGPEFIKPIPGFQLGAAYGTYPLSIVLRKAHADIHIRLIERIADKTWRYTFETDTGSIVFFKMSQTINKNIRTW